MNDDANTKPDDRSIDADTRDLLVSRIVDGEATGEDWNRFRAFAERDPSVWNDLADTQHQHEAMCEAVRVGVHAADMSELPELIPSGAPVLQGRLDMISKWGGWAAAAALVLVWATGFRPTAPQASVQTGGIGGGVSLSDASPDQAMQHYIESGQNAGFVVAEVPDRIVVETRPLPDGSIEVVYLRQIVERQITDRVYREVTDDAGRAVGLPVPTDRIRELKAY